MLVLDGCNEKWSGEDNLKDDGKNGGVRKFTENAKRVQSRKYNMWSRADRIATLFQR
jgi:hypothetical protein